MSEITDSAAVGPLAVDAAESPIEDRLRWNIHATLEALFEEKFDAFLGRCRTGTGRRLP